MPRTSAVCQLRARADSSRVADNSPGARRVPGVSPWRLCYNGNRSRLLRSRSPTRDWPALR